MNLIAILTNIRLPDVLDILFISIVVYQFYIWFVGTQAFKVLVGLAILSAIFVTAKSWGLFLTTWVFQILWPVFVILLIILFQTEIRQMLEHLNPLKMAGMNHLEPSATWVDGLGRWAFEAARKRMGALVILQNKGVVDEFITRGIVMECDPQAEILNAVFDKHSPLHDGGVLIANGKIRSVSCFLPLTTRDNLPRQWGTRHRAALGLTEKCDATVLIVYEERGTVAFADGEDIRPIQDLASFKALFTSRDWHHKPPQKGLGERIKGWLTRRYRSKIMVFGLVFVVWMAFAGQQNFEKRLELPLDLAHLPGHLALAAGSDQKIAITCRGLRKDVSLLTVENTRAVIDLSQAVSGSDVYPISTENLSLPNNRIQIAGISPSRVVLIMEPKPGAGPPDS